MAKVALCKYSSNFSLIIFMQRLPPPPPTKVRSIYLEYYFGKGDINIIRPAYSIFNDINYFVLHKEVNFIVTLYSLFIHYNLLFLLLSLL